ncbi:hypothetical protein D3C72_1299620 [compost metagenome]
MNGVLAIVLTAAGLECESHDVGVTVADIRPEEVAVILAQADGGVSALDLSAFVANLQVAKYDAYAPPDLLRKLWEMRHAREVEGVPQLIADLCSPPF